MSGLLSTTGNQNITDDQIRQFISGAQNERQIYDAALQHGVSAQQIANAMQSVNPAFSVNAINNYVAGQVAPPPPRTPSPTNLVNQAINQNLNLARQTITAATQQPIAQQPTAQQPIAQQPIAQSPTTRQPGITSQPIQLQGGVQQTLTPTYSDPRAAIMFGAGNNQISDQDIRNFITGAKSAEQIFTTALQYGISADQISRAMRGVDDRYNLHAITNWLHSIGIGPDAPPTATLPAGTERVGNPNLPLLQQIPTTQSYAQQANVPWPWEQEGWMESMREQFGAGFHPGLSQFEPAGFVQATQSPTHGTVAGQVNRVLDPHSPLMQRAAALGLQSAQSRGLLNSSIGIGAAQNAITDAALQMATPDAASHNQFALQNAETQNLMNRFNAEQALRSGMFNADVFNQNMRFDLEQANQMGRFNVEQGNIMSRFAAEQSNQLNLRMMDHAQQERMANIEMAHRNTLAASDNARQLYTAAMNQIGQIMGNMELDPVAKQSQVDAILTHLDNAMAVSGALANSGVAQNFGVAPQQTGLTPLNLSGGAGGILQEGGTPPAGSSGPGTTSAVTGEKIGPTGQGSFVISTGEKLSQDVSDAIQQIYGIDPSFLVVPELGVPAQGMMAGLANQSSGGSPSAALGASNLRFSTDPNYANQRLQQLGLPKPSSQYDGAAIAEYDYRMAQLNQMYPTREEVEQAIREGKVARIPLFDPNFGEPFHPAFKNAAGLNNMIYDPNNVLGLRA